MILAPNSPFQTIRAVAVAGTVLLTFGTFAQAQALDQTTMAAADLALLQDYMQYDDRCRGQTGDDPITYMACGARDYIGYLLNISGYCFGQSDQAGFEMQWHVCTGASNRFEKP